MSRRVALICFFQETNSFSALPTDRDAVRAGMIDGARLRERFMETQTEIAGALSVLDGAGTAVDCLPSLRLLPGGTLEASALAAYESKVETAFDRLERRPNAILAVLHGCTAADGWPDATGRFVRRLGKLGEGIPVFATADFHANMTDEIVNGCAVVTGYRTYPHTDLYETGERAARQLLHSLSIATRPQPLGVRLPLIVPTETSSHESPPMREVWRGLSAIEETSGFPASIFCPHPWLDAPDNAVTLLAYCAPDRKEGVREELARLARALWNSKSALYKPIPGLEDVWSEALPGSNGPALLVDSGDVVLAGAPGDSTAIIGFLKGRSAAGRRWLLHVTDAEAANRVSKLPAGSRVKSTVGGSIGAVFYPPTPIEATLVGASRETYRAAGPYERGIRCDPGARAVLDWRGHTLVVAERRDPAHDPAFWRSLGLNPMDYDVVAVKSHNTFRPAYAEISRTVLRAATPGATNPKLDELPYKGGSRRLYPLSAKVTP